MDLDSISIRVLPHLRWRHRRSLTHTQVRDVDWLGLSRVDRKRQRQGEGLAWVLSLQLWDFGIRDVERAAKPYTFTTAARVVQ